MAAATIVQTNIPNILVKITGTNIDAGANVVDLTKELANLSKGVTIQTGTLTAMDVKIFGSADGVKLTDITNDLCGVASLVSNSIYIVDINLPLQNLRVVAIRSNAVNAVDVSIYAPKR